MGGGEIRRDWSVSVIAKMKIHLSAKYSCIVGLGIIWLTISLFGVGGLISYSQVSGDTAAAPNTWPKESSLAPSVDPKLLLFLHPDCSCSAATVGELDRLLTQVPKKLKTYAIFIRPQGWSDKEVKGHLWNQVSTIPRVNALIDSDGREAGLFGARTSGFSVLYDEAGYLKFSGGITASRGHMGDNLGASTIINILKNHEVRASSKVFGCGLFDRSILAMLPQKMARLLPEGR